MSTEHPIYREGFFIREILYAIGVTSYIVCFIVFQQGDLEHTYNTSFALLNGHIPDFYDYTSKTIGGNDYLPSIFFVMAIWGLPLKLLGLLEGSNYHWLILAWYKILLLVTFYLTSAATAQLYGLVYNQENTKRIKLSTLSNPIATFIIVIFCGYDIIGLYFVMLGLIAYAQNRTLAFVAWFSIAASFKFFALLPFFPLVLLKEKNPLRATFLLAGSLLVILTEAAYYLSDPAFLDSCCSLARRKIFTEPLHHNALAIKSAISIMVYGLICWVSIKLNGEEGISSGRFISIAGASYAAMLSGTHWHPQWLIIVVPFISIYSERWVGLIEYSIIDFIAYYSFLIVSTSLWRGNIDIAMSQNGMLPGLVSLSELEISSIFPHFLLYPAMLIISIYIMAPHLAAFQWSHYLQRSIGGSNLRTYLLRGVLGPCIFLLLFSWVLIVAPPGTY